MPHELEQYFIHQPGPYQAAISLTLTNTITHPPDPTSTIDVALLIDEGTIISEPEIEVSITHA